MKDRLYHQLSCSEDNQRFPWNNPWLDQVLDAGVLPKNLLIALDAEKYHQISCFRNKEYIARYPQVTTSNCDVFDNHSVTFYYEHVPGLVSGTARLVMDSELGLPEEEVLEPFVRKCRKRGELVAEFGRFVIQEGSQSTLKAFYQCIYRVGLALGVAEIFFLVRQKELNFYRKRIGADVLKEDTGLSFGSDHLFAAVSWRLENTNTHFLQWLEGVKE